MAVKDTRKKRSSCSSSAERTPQRRVSQARDASSSSSTPRYLLPTVTSNNRQRVSSVSSHPRSPSNFGSRSGDRGASATTTPQNNRLSKSCEHDEKSSSRVKTPTPKTRLVSEKTSASGSHRHGDTVVDLTRSTCSSDFKRVGDAAGSSHRSRCRYSYCSLNDHEHRHSPPLKQFLSTRRVLMKQKSLKAQKSFKSGSSSKASKGRFGRDVDTGQIGGLGVEMFEISDKKDDFGVEVFVKGVKKDDSGVEIFENGDKKDDFDTNLDPGCRESVECSEYEAEQETDDEAPMLKIHDVCGEAKGSGVDGMKDGDVFDSKPTDDLCDEERAVSIGIDIKDSDVLDSKASEVDSSFNADSIPAGILEERREDNLSPPQTDDAESFDKDAMEPDRCVNSSERDPSKPLVSLEDDPVKNLHVEKSSEGNSEMILSLNEFSFEGDSVDGSPVLENELHELVACNKDVANIDVQGFSDRSIENNLEFSLEGADMQESVVCPQSVSSEDAIAQESASCLQFVQTCNSENIATNLVQFSILADSDAGGVPEMKQKQVETSEENVANCSIEGMGNYSSEIDGSHGMDEEKDIEITDGMISVPENITGEDACLEIPENSDIQDDEPLKQDEGSFPSISEGITMECENNIREEIDESAGNLEGESDISNCDNEGVEGQSTESGGSPISSLQCVQKGVVVNEIHQSVEEGNEILQSAEEGNGVYKSAKRSLEFVNSNSDLEESCDGSIESNQEVDQLFLEIASLQCVQKNEINKDPESVENQSLEIENDISALEGKSDRFRGSRQEVEQPSLEIASNVDDFGGECDNITERSPKVQQPPLEIDSHVDDFGGECGNITESSPEAEETSLDIASHVDDLGKECINATESSNDIEQPEQKSESNAFARTEDDNETEEFDIMQEGIAESGSEDDDDYDYDDAPDIVELLAATKEGNDEDESGAYDSALKSLETLFASFKSRKFSGMASSEQEGSQITQNGKFDCDNTGMVSGDRDSYENRISEAFDSVIDRSLIDDAKENCINIVKSILAGSLDQNHAFSSRSKKSGKVSRSNSIKKISWGKRKVHPSMDEMPENEKVSLMHQDANERRAAYEWMVDYALRELVNKLAPFRKTKVDLLIEAFEAISLSNSKKSGLERPEKNPAKGLVQKKKL